MTVKKSKGGNKRQRTVVWLGEASLNPYHEEKGPVLSRRLLVSSQTCPWLTQRWLQRGDERYYLLSTSRRKDGLPLLTSHPIDRSSWTHDSACGPINKVSQLTRNRRCYLLPKPTKKGCLSQHALLRRVARDALGPERHLFHRPGIRSESFCFSID